MGKRSNGLKLMHRDAKVLKGLSYAAYSSAGLHVAVGAFCQYYDALDLSRALQLGIGSAICGILGYAMQRLSNKVKDEANSLELILNNQRRD